MNMHLSIGSSPRVRGTHEHADGAGAVRRFIPACAGNAVHAGGDVKNLRFIPACAGNASGTHARMKLPSVHPRVCGERATIQAARYAFGGSSPRVRGTLLQARR